MPKAKKAGGKKKKATKGSKKNGGGNSTTEIKTTPYIISGRESCICPRLGEAYHRSSHVEEIKSSLAITAIRKAIESSSDALDVAGCAISVIPRRLISNEYLRQEIVCLNLARNRLYDSELAFEALCELKVLRRLDLRGNDLVGKLSEKAGRLHLLEEVHLDDNHLTGLPTSCCQWKNLQVFTASKNSLKALPDGVKQWSNLRECNVRSNELTTLPDAIYNWTKLETLFAANNKLKSLPLDFGNNMTSLKKLELTGNELEDLPENMLSHCAATMVYLNLASNRLTTLPTKLFTTHSTLRELQLYRNRLTDLPPSIKNLAHLTRLSVSNNKLKTFPEELGDCASLRELYANYNATLSELPFSMGRLTRLEELALRGNPKLKFLPSSMTRCEELKHLDLRIVGTGAGKKEVCKLAPELREVLGGLKCVVRGGVSKKGKGAAGKGKKKK